MIQKTRVAVIGAGHAGIEAALASARMGMDTILFTMSLDAIANMPCNPSIGGTAKGHLVYEIDALGGQMGITADQSLTQLRMLNSSKGPAVHSLRAQIDKYKYHHNKRDSRAHVVRACIFEKTLYGVTDKVYLARAQLLRDVEG